MTTSDGRASPPEAPDEFARGRAQGITEVVDSIQANPEKWLPRQPEGSTPVPQSEPVAWLWTSKCNGHVQAFVTKPPPSMLADPQCQPLYTAAPPSSDGREPKEQK